LQDLEHSPYDHELHPPCTGQSFILHFLVVTSGPTQLLPPLLGLGLLHDLVPVSSPQPQVLLQGPNVQSLQPPSLGTVVVALVVVIVVVEVILVGAVVGVVVVIAVPVVEKVEVDPGV